MEKFNVSYEVWKTVFGNHSWSGFEIKLDLQDKIIITGNADFIFTSRVNGDTYQDYSSSLQENLTPVSSSDDAFALLISGIDNIKEQQRDALGNPIFSLPKMQKDLAPLFAIQGRMGSEAIYATHNLCDETTWYNGSTRLASASLEQSGSCWHYPSVDRPWIDMKHGKIFDEEGLMQDQKIFATAANDSPHGYSVEIFVDGTQKTERAAFAVSGGDYYINYTSGTVHPADQDWTGLEVLANFSYKNKSDWALEPLPGKELIMEKAEVQFSDDLLFATGLVMSVEAYAAIFAPDLIQSNGGPLPDNARILIEKTVYKTVDQVVDEAIMAFPLIPPIGGTARGFARARNVFQFHYGSVRKLYSSLGMRVIVSLEGNIPFGGERATATFYCMSTSDSGVHASLSEMGLM